MNSHLDYSLLYQPGDEFEQAYTLGRKDAGAQRRGWRPPFAVPCGVPLRGSIYSGTRLPKRKSYMKRCNSATLRRGVRAIGAAIVPPFDALVESVRLVHDIKHLS